jgi:hypothetical protein
MLIEKTDSCNSLEKTSNFAVNQLTGNLYSSVEYSPIIQTQNFQNSKQHIQTDLYRLFTALGAKEGYEYYLMLMLPESLLIPGTEQKDNNGDVFAGMHRKTNKLVYLKQTLLLTIDSLQDYLCDFSITFMKRSNRYVPRQKIEVEGWEKGKNLSAGWLFLKQQNELGYNIYFRPNRGGTFDTDIKDINLLFFETDDQTITLEERIAISQNFGLQPTFAMFTGSKSPQWYYRLDRNISHEQFREYCERGIKLFKSDPHIKNPGRLMRLPGFCHAKYDEATETVKLSPSRILFANPDNVYPLEVLNRLFPDNEKDKLINHVLSVKSKAEQFARKLGIENSCDFKNIDGLAFSPKGMPLEKFDLTAFFDKVAKDVYELGVENDRNNALFRFSAFVSRREEYLTEKYGASFIQSSLELVEIAGDRCTPSYSYKEINRIYHNAKKHGNELSEDEKFFIDLYVAACVDNWKNYGKFEAEVKNYSGDGSGVSREIKALRTFIPTRTINVRYLNQVLNVEEYMNEVNKAVIAINSPTGTGKSTLIEKITEIAKQQNRIVLYATILNSTGKQASKKAGLKHKYFICDPNGTFACCIDSIAEFFERFEETSLDGCILIIDEFNSVQKEILVGRRLEKTIYSEQTKEVKTRRSSVMSDLKRLGRLASKVFLMDANLCDLDIDSATELYFSDFNVHKILNTYKSQEEYIIYQLSDDIKLSNDKKAKVEEFKANKASAKDIEELMAKEFPKASHHTTHREAISMFKADVEKLMLERSQQETLEPKVLVLTSDSKRMLKTVRKTLSKKFSNIRILLVCQDTKEEDEVKQFMENPDVAAKNYDVLLLSPTAGIGVDLAENFYEQAYFIHYGQIGATGCIQMIKRVRYPRNPRKIFLQGIATLSGRLSKSTSVSEILSTIERHSESYTGLIESMLKFSKGHNFYDSLSFSQDSNGRLCNPITNYYAKYLAVDNHERLCNWQCFLDKVESEGVKVTFGEVLAVEDIEDELKLAKEEILNEETNEFFNAPLLVNQLTEKLDIEEAWVKKNDETAKRLEKIRAEKTILYYEYPVNWTWEDIREQIIKHPERPILQQAKLALSIKYPDFETMIEYERLLKAANYDGKKQVQYLPKRKSDSIISIYHNSGIWELVENKTEVTNDSKEILKIKKYMIENKPKFEEFLGSKLQLDEHSNAKNITLINTILKKIGRTLDETKRIRIDGTPKRFYKVNELCEDALFTQVFKVLENKHKHELYPSCVIPGRFKWEKEPEIKYTETIDPRSGKTSIEMIPVHQISKLDEISLALNPSDSPTIKLEKIIVNRQLSTVRELELYLQNLPVDEYNAIMTLIYDDKIGRHFLEPYQEFIAELARKEEETKKRQQEKQQTYDQHIKIYLQPKVGDWVKIKLNSREIQVKVEGLLPMNGFEYTNSYGQYANHIGDWKEVSNLEKLEQGLS